MLEGCAKEIGIWVLLTEWVAVCGGRLRGKFAYCAACRGGVSHRWWELAWQLFIIRV